MREHEHALRLLPALALIVGGVLGALVACTPIQGYPGLERPKQEVALVTIASNHINRAVTDGREFGAAGNRAVTDGRSLGLQGSGCSQAVTALSSLPVMANRLMVVGPTPSLIRTVLIGVKRSAKPLSARGRKTPRNACCRSIRNIAKPASAITATQLARSPCRSSQAKNTNSQCLHLSPSRLA
jgi:hypothetical protein